MKFSLPACADKRALLGATLGGSALGVAFGAAFLAGGFGRAADQQRAVRIATEAQGAYAEQRLPAGQDAAVLRLAKAHDPLVTTDAQLARLDARLGDRSRLTEALDPTREIDCLTQAVYFEARGETAQGQQAVAQVVLNRVKSPLFPKTVCGVVFQGASTRGCQFSFACDGSTRARREPGAWDRARRVASRAMAGAIMPEIGAATHFHTTAVSPNWGGMMRVAQVGTHVFYRKGNRPAAPAVVDDALEPKVVLTSVPAKPVLDVQPQMRAPATPESAAKPKAPTHARAASAVQPVVAALNEAREPQLMEASTD